MVGGKVLALIHAKQVPQRYEGRKVENIKYFPHLLYKWLLEQWNERIRPWNVNVNLKKRSHVQKHKCQFVLLRIYFLNEN